MRLGLLLILLFTLTTHAQETAPAPAAVNANEPNQLETIFESLDHKFRVQAILEFPNYSFYLGAPAIQGVAYVPNFHPRVGPKIFYEEHSLTFTFPLPIPDAEKRRRGNTEQTEIMLNSYWRQTALDLYYVRISGFYIASPWVELSAHKPERYPQVPEAVVTTYGFNYYHVLSPERYSLKAGFDQTEFQKATGGSWVITPFYTHTEMSIGSQFIPGIGDDRVTSMPVLAGARLDTVGASVGYGHSYISGRFFASSIAAVGNGIQYQRLGRTGDKDIANVTLALKLNLNLAIGYNYKEWVSGIKLILDSLSSKVGGTQVSNNLVAGQFFFGRRF